MLNNALKPKYLISHNALLTFLIIIMFLKTTGII